MLWRFFSKIYQYCCALLPYFYRHVCLNYTVNTWRNSHLIMRQYDMQDGRLNNHCLLYWTALFTLLYPFKKDTTTGSKHHFWFCKIFKTFSHSHNRWQTCLANPGHGPAHTRRSRYNEGPQNLGRELLHKPSSYTQPIRLQVHLLWSAQPDQHSHSGTYQTPSVPKVQKHLTLIFLPWMMVLVGIEVSPVPLGWLFCPTKI